MSEINLVTANNFESTAESRKALIAKLSYDERKIFIEFVKSVNPKLVFGS